MSGRVVILGAGPAGLGAALGLARRGFEVVKRLIVPGNPIQSRWLLKPLHLDGGGSYTHNGPRRWLSKDDPEWQMLAAWVRGERTGSDCSM